VLAEVGVQVDHAAVRKMLTAVGGMTDGTTDRVRFPAQTVERIIAEAPKEPQGGRPPEISLSAGIYKSWYLDPESNALLSFNEYRLALYIGLAKSLPRLRDIGMLGVPFVPEGIPAEYTPLAEKLYAWKYAVGMGGGSVQLTGLCQSILDLFSCHASMNKKRVEEVFCATGYLISPLRLARPECEQMLFFHKHGLQMGIGHLPIQGGTAPVTFAGAVTLALAEQIFLYILQRAFGHNPVFAVGGTVSTMDMRSGSSCYGRPEQQRINAAFADIARFYGCGTWGHTGSTDAKTPSYEAGAQKAYGALYTALACGRGNISAGLLSLDEICSPVQMVLDHDLAGALQALLAQPSFSDTDCAFEEIAAVGPGGCFMGTDFTAARFRGELFMPAAWNYRLVDAWQRSGCRTDVEAAIDLVCEFERSFSPKSNITEEEERELRKIIKRAVDTRAADG
jgi:trimethylamine--corrinoid protein Co-methyltransferase